MRKYMFLILLFPLALLSACNLSLRSIVERNARATQRAEDLATFEALYGTLPPTAPFDPFGTIGDRYCGLVNCDTATPTPPVTATPATLVPTQAPPSGDVLIDAGNSEYAKYYSSSTLDPNNQLGLVLNGSSWKVIQVTKTAIRIQLSGWVPEQDFDKNGEDVTVKSCFYVEHNWSHARNVNLCHTSIWGSALLANVPSGTLGKLASSSATNRTYRDTATGSFVNGLGWDVAFELEAWIPISNGNLQ